MQGSNRENGNMCMADIMRLHMDNKYKDLYDASYRNLLRRCHEGELENLHIVPGKKCWRCGQVNTVICDSRYGDYWCISCRSFL